MRRILIALTILALIAVSAGIGVFVATCPPCTRSLLRHPSKSAAMPQSALSSATLSTPAFEIN
jgi:hypothetical protein